MTRVGNARLLQLAGELSQRERDLILTLDKLRLATHRQLTALLLDASSGSSPSSAARSARRILARLTTFGILGRLERRIGGIRAGSAGYVYYPGSVGQRLVAYWEGRGLVRGRFRPEPGGRYVRHRLAVSELFVQATVAARGGELDLLGFDVEPACWRSSADGFGGQRLLKPDAFVELGVGDYVHSSFVEVDLGSESRTVIAAKVRAYIDYFHSGTEQAAHGAFPRVLLLTTTEARRAALIDVCAVLPPERWELFTITTLDRGLAAMSDQVKALSQEVGQ